MGIALKSSRERIIRDALKPFPGGFPESRSKKAPFLLFSIFQAFVCLKEALHILVPPNF